MNANDCRTVRREIDASELGQRLSQSLEMHVSACAGCAQFRDERAQLRELVGSLKPVGAPADFDLRLRARIARDKDARAQQPFIFRFAMTTPAIAVAALIVLSVASIVWLNQKNQTPRPEIASGKPNNDKPATATTSPTNPSDAGSQPKEVVAGGSQPETQKRQGPWKGNAAKPLPTSGNLPSEVSEFNMKAAQSIRQTRDRAGEVSFAAPSKPMVVSVQDANGTTHKILLPPISFGSQRLDNRTTVSMSDRRDW